MAGSTHKRIVAGTTNEGGVPTTGLDDIVAGSSNQHTTGRTALNRLIVGYEPSITQVIYIDGQTVGKADGAKAWREIHKIR